MIAYLTGPVWVNVFSQIEYGPAMRLATWAALPLVAVLAIQSVFQATERPRAFGSVSLVADGRRALTLGVVATTVTPTAFAFPHWVFSRADGGGSAGCGAAYSQGP